MFQFSDLSNADRIALLLEWYEASEEQVFFQVASALTSKPVGGFTSWSDGVGLVRMARDIGLAATEERDDPRTELKVRLENAIITMLDGYVWPDDLENICQEIDGARLVLSNEVLAAVDAALVRQVKEIDTSVADMESESMLEDQIRVLKEFAPRAGVSAEKLHRAVETIESRISEIAAQVDAASPPDVSGPSLIERDVFDDDALKDLFAPLIWNAN